MPAVSIAQAADRLGVSADTVRRRMRTGVLAWERGPDGARLVLLPDMPAGPAAGSTPVEHQKKDAGEVAALLAEVRADRDRLAAVVEAQTAQLAAAGQERAAAAQERSELRRLLAAAMESAHLALPPAEVAPDRPRRRWWRRLIDQGRSTA